jgi:HK97 family phage portal protein
VADQKPGALGRAVAWIDRQLGGNTSPAEVQVAEGPRAQDWPGWWWSNPSYRHVSDTEALSIPSVWRCVSLISGLMAGMPIHAYRDYDRLPAPRLLTDPHPQLTRFDVWWQLLTDLLLNGNGLAILGDFDELGYPRSFEPIPALAVGARTVGSIVLEYRYRGQELDPAQVMHLHGFTPAGSPFGIGAVQALSQALGGSLETRDYAAGWFSNAGIPSGLFKVHELTVTQEQADELRERWRSRHAGPYPEPGVLNEVTDFQPVAVNPAESQLVAARQANDSDVAMMFGVPPKYVNASQRSMTYSNTEWERRELVDFTLMPWIHRAEQALTRMLPGRQFARFNPDALLRSDTHGRFAAYKIALDGGWMTVDEVRRLEGLPPLGDPQIPTEGREDEPRLEVMG